MSTTFRPVVKRTYGSKKRISDTPSVGSTSRGSTSSEWEGATDPDSSFTIAKDAIDTPPSSPRPTLKAQPSQSTERTLRDSTAANIPKRRLIGSSSPSADSNKSTGSDLRSFFSKISPKKRQRNQTEQDHSYTSNRGNAFASTSTLSTALKAKRVKPLEQLYLDPFTTASHATLSCPTCSMSYARTPSDILLHDKHHKKVVGGCDWISNENEMECCVEIGNCIEWGKESGGRIVMTDIVTEGALGRKIKEIIAMIDLELSATSLPVSVLQESKLIVLVTKKKKVVAAALVQRIDSAFQVVASTYRDANVEELMRFGEEEGAVFCSPTPTSARLGIHRIYTSPSHRRFSLASIILDSVVARFIYGYPISKEDVAFSQPTGAGMSLARNWTGTNYFKVFVE